MKFTKMHGAGNDYVYVDAFAETLPRDIPSLAIAVMIFLVGFVLFESILGISGRDYFGPVGKAALPVLLILVGVILLVRSIQRSRKT